MHIHEGVTLELFHVAYPDGSALTPPTGPIRLKNYRDVADADLPTLVYEPIARKNFEVSVNDVSLKLHWHERFTPGVTTPSYSTGPIHEDWLRTEYDIRRMPSTTT